MSFSVTPEDQMGPLLSTAIEHFVDAGAVRVWIAYGPGDDPPFKEGVLHIILQYEYSPERAETAVKDFAEQQINIAMERGSGLFSGMEFNDVDIDIERILDLEARDRLGEIAKRADHIRFEGRTWPVRIDVTPATNNRPKALAPVPKNAFLVAQADDDDLTIEDSVGLEQVRQYCEQLKYGYQPDSDTPVSSEHMVESTPTGGLRDYIELPEELLAEANIKDRTSVTVEALDGFIAIRRGTSTQRYKPLNQTTVTDGFTTGL